ncbi:hypothetical protein ACROYT_G017888 [Oculina patagonica]
MNARRSSSLSEIPELPGIDAAKPLVFHPSSHGSKGKKEQRKKNRIKESLRRCKSTPEKKLATQNQETKPDAWKCAWDRERGYVTDLIAKQTPTTKQPQLSYFAYLGNNHQKRGRYQAVSGDSEVVINLGSGIVVQNCSSAYTNLEEKRFQGNTVHISEPIKTDTAQLVECCSCMCCVKAVFYHCTKDDEFERNWADEPCACEMPGTECVARCECRDVDIFHQHLNTIDPNIQFTIERASQNEKGQSISFLDTRVTALSDGSLEVDVFRKKTHTNKYLDYNSHNLLQHKEAVVRTLLNRATNLPSNESLKSAETKRVAKVLRANGYPDRLLQKCLTVNSRPERTQERPANFASIPYVRGASDRVGRVLRKFNIRTAFKPCQTLSQIFKKPKDRPQDHQRRGIVYKVRCNDCVFTYIGESKRSWS